MDPLLKDFWIEDTKAEEEGKLRGPYDFHFLKTLEGIAVIKGDTPVFEDTTQTWVPWSEIRQRKLTTPPPAADTPASAPTAAAASSSSAAPKKAPGPGLKPALNVVIPQYNKTDAPEKPSPAGRSTLAATVPASASVVPSADAVAVAVAAAQAAKAKVAAEAEELARKQALAAKSAQPTMPAADWYFMQFGEQVGPAATPDLVDLLNLGKVPRDALVWCDGMKDWTPAQDVAVLARFLKAETPPEPDRPAAPSPAAKKAKSAAPAPTEEEREQALLREIAASKAAGQEAVPRKGALHYLITFSILAIAIGGLAYAQYKYDFVSTSLRDISEFLARQWADFLKYTGSVKWFRSS